MKISLSTFLLFISLIIIFIMGLFIYNTRIHTYENDNTLAQNDDTELSTKSVSDNENNLQDIDNKENTDLYIVQEINIDSDDYLDHQEQNDRDVLYSFKDKKWTNTVEDNMYYIAIDNMKRLYIVDKYEDIVAKLDAKLEKLPIYDSNVDNFVTLARVSKNDNTLVIYTADDFVTFVVDLNNFSVRLLEIVDD